MDIYNATVSLLMNKLCSRDHIKQTRVLFIKKNDIINYTLHFDDSKETMITTKFKTGKKKQTTMTNEKKPNNYSP